MNVEYCFSFLYQIIQVVLHCTDLIFKTDRARYACAQLLSLSGLHTSVPLRQHCWIFVLVHSIIVELSFVINVSG